MKKSRKNYAMRIPAILLILTMTSLCMVSGTFAKYTIEKSAEDSARLAKFAFSLNDQDMAASDSITVDFFKNAYLGGKVTGKDNAKVVAPGTSGTFALKIENTGEVALKTTFTFEETNEGNIPIQYAVTTTEAAPTDDAEWKTAAEAQIPGASLAVVGAKKWDNDSHQMVDLNEPTESTQYIHWRWKTASDEADTALGTAETPATVTTKITCTATQDVS